LPKGKKAERISLKNEAVNPEERIECHCHQQQRLSGSYQQNKKKILHGLRRVEGQVRGIQRMVGEERYCIDVLNQIAAARMALSRLALIILKDHTRGCVSRAFLEKDREEEIMQELIEVVKKLM
jgi:DNA-binding FrmR family transcriptional regulator